MSQNQGKDDEFAKVLASLKQIKKSKDELEQINSDLKSKLLNQAKEVESLSKKSSIAHFDAQNTKEQERKMESKIKELTSKLNTVEINHSKIVAEADSK